jgi:hypothetical protein
MSEPSPSKRGFRDLVLVIVAAALIISPSYVGGYLFTHGKLGVTSTALVSLAMFVVGVFLIVRLLKE